MRQSDAFPLKSYPDRMTIKSKESANHVVLFFPVSSVVNAAIQARLPTITMTNKALEINPPSGQRHITVHASNWLWTVFAIMLLSLFTTFFWTCLRRDRNRIPYHIPIIVLAVSSIAYYSMASDLGFTVVPNRRGTRQVWVCIFSIFASIVLLRGLISGSCTVCEIHTVVHQCSPDSPRPPHLHRHDRIRHRYDSFLCVGSGGNGARWCACA